MPFIKPEYIPTDNVREDAVNAIRHLASRIVQDNVLIPAEASSRSMEALRVIQQNRGLIALELLEIADEAEEK